MSAVPRLSLTLQSASRLPGIPDKPAFRKWIRAALEQDADVTLRVVNAAEGRRLNQTYRKRDYATNVLTFVYHAPDAKQLCGDIVFCAPVVAREAREQGKPLHAHYAHLAVHATLHLAGYDHVRKRDATIMENREIGILHVLRIANPYQSVW